MKYLILLLIVGCTVKTSNPERLVPVLRDTCIEKPVIHDTIPVIKYRDSIVYTKGNQQKTIDSLKTKLFVAKYKIERVRYYLKICLRNPSQDKFLKGWIKRAIE